MFNSYLYIRTMKDKDSITNALHLTDQRLASKIMSNLDKYITKNMKPLRKIIRSFENNVHSNQMSNSEAIDQIAYEAGNDPKKMLLTNSLIWNLIYNFKMNLYNHKHLYLVHINTFADQNAEYVQHLKTFRDHTIINHRFAHRITPFVSSLGAKINTSLYHQCKQWRIGNDHSYPYVLIKINKKHNKAKLENLSSDVITRLINYLDAHAYSDSRKYFAHLAKFAVSSSKLFYPNQSKVTYHGFKHPSYIKSLA